jgi:hypothetical protein
MCIVTICDKFIFISWIIWPDLIWIIWHPLIEIFWNIHKCVTQPSMTLHWYQIHTDPHWFWLIHTAWCWGLKFNSCRQVLSNANPLREFKLHMKLQQLNIIKRYWDNNSEFLKEENIFSWFQYEWKEKEEQVFAKNQGKTLSRSCFLCLPLSLCKGQGGCFDTKCKITWR